ncbi:AsmA family protein [Alisedimentitalea sp. MJ-SS2]|uniref:AsmA family protein n=1 Tax=Aliisedimentitalea sp. MJ-SS2 TaxID=3049795 RepID=UPI00291528E9|nr:AsmA family protein [Alisedimentitalea sp. MJ-SS2]MDU8927307.1 AsmA family protein [Alisedimentitalea sp. MJ-SS2]
MRWIFRVAVILALVVVLLGAVVLILPGERVAAVALDQIRAATGRDVQLEGDVDLKYFPVLRVRTGPINIANADWSDRGPMLQAEGLLIGVETRPLFSGQIRIKTLELDRPELLLERHDDGRVNWEIEAGSGGSGGRQFAVGLDQFVMRDGRVLILDHGRKTRQSFERVEVKLRAPDLQGRAELDVGFRAEGHEGGAATLTAEVAALMPFLDGVVVPLTFGIEAEKGRFEFTGRANTRGDAEGDVAVNLPSSAAFAGAVGLPRMSPPRGLGQTIKASGKLVLTEGEALALRQIDLALDHNELNIDVDIDLSAKRPYATARVRAGTLDFSALSGGSGGGQAATTWSDEPLDAGALGQFNGQARLTAGAIDFGSLKLGKSEVMLNLERSRAVFTLVDVAAHRGTLGGEFVINNRGGLSVGGKLTMTGVEARDLLRDSAKIKAVSGKSDGHLNFLGVGGSIAKIMKSLKGDGSIRIVDGLFEGISLDRVMLKQDGGRSTPFDSLTAGFTLIGGNLQNRDLTLVMEDIEARGEGRVGIGAMDIDYLFTPVALRARGGQGVAVPVRIRGPWSDVKVMPDLRSVITLNFKEEIKAAEKKIEDAVRERVEQETGVVVEEGQSLEDALKEKAEDELKKGLLKLLD